MSQVVVKINGRDFPLSCPDGQEPRIRRLAQYVDAKTVEFRNSLGQIGEARLMLLAAIVIADELLDTSEALANALDVGIRQRTHKFIATEPHDQVVGAQSRPQRRPGAG